MTFGNPTNQQTIYKCNRILAKSLPQFKEKCLISPIEIPIRKNLKEKFVDSDTMIIKPSRTGSVECFLYVVGPLSESDQIYYGRVTYSPT